MSFVLKKILTRADSVMMFCQKQNNGLPPTAEHLCVMYECKKLCLRIVVDVYARPEAQAA